MNAHSIDEALEKLRRADEKRREASAELARAQRRLTWAVLILALTTALNAIVTIWSFLHG